MKSLVFISTLIVLFAVACGVVVGQSAGGASARKLTEFGEINADSAQAHLDMLAAALSTEASARGYIIGYPEKQTPPGYLMMKLYGYLDYLVNKRGVEQNRVVVITGGVKDKPSTELWLVPKGAPAPRPDSELKIVVHSPLKFDVAYPDCPPEYSIDLYELRDSLKFYAAALRENPQTRAWIIGYPGHRSSFRRVSQIVRGARGQLARKYSINAGRIILKTRNQRRECSEVELWIVPAGMFPPAAAQHN